MRYYHQYWNCQPKEVYNFAESDRISPPRQCRCISRPAPGQGAVFKSHNNNNNNNNNNK